MPVMLQVAWGHLIAQRRRHALVAAAIAAVTGVFLLLDGLSKSIDRGLEETATALATGHVNVNGVFKPNPSKALPILGGYAAVSSEIERLIPELDFLVQRGRGMAKLVSDRRATDVQLTGIDVAREGALRAVVHTLQGDIDRLADGESVLLFQTTANELSVGVGDVITVSTETVRGSATARDWRVVAIAQDIGLLSSGTAFTSIQSMRELYEVRDDVTGGLQLYLKLGRRNEFADVAERVRNGLRAAGYQVIADPGPMMQKIETAGQAGWIGQRIDVSTWKDELAAFEWSHQLMLFLSAGLLTILLGIAGIGVVNILWVATRERTREIGMLRAIGMQRRAVVGMFVLEAMALGLLSAAFGAAGCLAAATLINAIGIPVPIAVQVFILRNTLTLAPDLHSIAMAIMLMAVVCGAAACYPAWRAGRYRPVDAMTRG